MCIRDSYQPGQVFKSAADPDLVRDLVAALLKASQPIINAGQGVLWAEATDELVEFAALPQVPVLTTMPGKSAIPENHKLALGTGGHTATLMADRFLKKTDFMLWLGTSFTISSFNAPVPTGVPLAQDTKCAEDLYKVYAFDFGAIGDATSPEVQNETVFALATILLLVASWIALRSCRSVIERLTHP